MKKILMILTMALAATSCMDILDVAPEDQIASENMWTTEELADKGMAGLYFPFYATQLSSTQLRRADGLNRQGITGRRRPCLQVEAASFPEPKCCRKSGHIGSQWICLYPDRSSI